MPASAEQVATDVERRAKEIGLKINEIINQQAVLQSRLVSLQAKRDTANRDKIKSLKAVVKEATLTIGVLARSRTELLDGLPIIATASGELDVVAEELGKKTKLLERTVERLKKVTKTIQAAEKTIVKIASLAKSVLM